MEIPSDNPYSTAELERMNAEMDRAVGRFFCWLILFATAATGAAAIIGAAIGFK